MAFAVAGAAAVAGVVYATWRPADQPAAAYRPYTADELVPPPAKGAKVFSTTPDGAGLLPRRAATGPASVGYGTLHATVARIAAGAFGDRPALRTEKKPYPADGIGTWATLTWREYNALARRFAKSLLSVGFRMHESVAVCSFNCPEWHVAQIGANYVGGMTAGTYTTNAPDLCAFIATDSSARVVVVDTMSNATKYVQRRKELPLVQCVVVIMDEVPDAAAADGFVISFDKFLAKGDAIGDDALDARSALTKDQHCASLIYTSGTTGNPKGVMASHDSLLFSAAVAITSMDLPELPEQRSISYLPLSHIAAQMLDIVIPTFRTAAGQQNCIVYYARPDVLKGSLPITLKGVRPTIFFGVPRVYEKFVEGIKAKAKAAPPPGKAKAALINWAKEVGLANSRAKQVNGDGRLCRGTHIAAKLVHAKVREALGLDQCQRFATGAAPIALGTMEFLASLGIDIFEVYGMSETMGMGTASSSVRFQFGSCGTISAYTELKTEHVEGRDKPGEGEICFRGRHVMMGYLNNEEKTREAIDPDGWMHSGDVGSIDAKGMVRITGRIKELIIGAGGENIAPVPIEDELKRLLPGVSNAVLIGDKRKFNVVLFTLKTQPNLDNGTFTSQLILEAKDVSAASQTVEQALRDPVWQKYLEAGRVAYNAGPKCVSNAQKVQKFAILPAELSIPGGELTPTMKLKRNVLVEKYAALIDALYEGSE